MQVGKLGGKSSFHIQYVSKSTLAGGGQQSSPALQGASLCSGAQRDVPISRAQARSLSRGCAISGTRKDQSERAAITCEDRWAHLMLH